MIATLALLIFPFFALALFAALGAPRGLIWSVILGYLFLPQAYAIELPILPPYDKTAAVSYSVLLGALCFGRGQILAGPQDRLFKGVLIGLGVLMLAAPFATAVTNSDPIVTGNVVRPAYTLYDALREIVVWGTSLTPLILGILLLRRAEDRRHLLVAVVAVGLGYSLLVLFELRMSPQLHNWIYGYFPHSWLQHVRDGGYRPIVFLRHGLWLGFFLLTATLSAFALARQDGRRGSIWVFAGLWLLAVLLLSKNLGAALLALMFLPAVLMTTMRFQFRVAAIMAVVFLAYPLLSTMGLSPEKQMLRVAERIDEGRAASLAFRLENDDLFLGRALERPAFGWGGHARNRIFSDDGRDISTSDGLWISRFGRFGWLGYISYFGFITAPLFFLGRAYRRQSGLDPAVAGMALIMAANLIYLIPNSALSPIGFLMCGAIAAFVLTETSKEQEVTPPPLSAKRDQPRYTRFARTETPLPHRRFSTPTPSPSDGG